VRDPPSRVTFNFTYLPTSLCLSPLSFLLASPPTAFPVAALRLQICGREAADGKYETTSPGAFGGPQRKRNQRNPKEKKRKKKKKKNRTRLRPPSSQSRANSPQPAFPLSAPRRCTLFRLRPSDPLYLINQASRYYFKLKTTTYTETKNLLNSYSTNYTTYGGRSLRFLLELLKTTNYASYENSG